ncbi:unnamed protein product [Pieris macdunnoughi]|uniref:Kinesin motor domain-containing protein n=1 Tax=Pieris macdunnoughi TaxID=345717 RepID=A0A821XEV6_9NEOP|nr:unnamed protein product [Pieris macdunnoughi]
MGGTVENVRVVVRLRPMDQREKIDGTYNCVSVDSVNNTIAVTRSNVSPPDPPRIYAYDAVFDSNTSQTEFSGSDFDIQEPYLALRFDSEL